jgi:hypothetical protein
MNKRFSDKELYEIRTHLQINIVIKNLMIPNKMSEGFLRFLCPCCKEFQTAVNPKTNLARCFRCERNMNTIEIVMLARGAKFVDSVKYLQKLALNSNEPEVVVSLPPKESSRSSTPLDSH